jgi:hypothetical protein
MAKGSDMTLRTRIHIWSINDCALALRKENTMNLSDSDLKDLVDDLESIRSFLEWSQYSEAQELADVARIWLNTANAALKERETRC